MAFVRERSGYSALLAAAAFSAVTVGRAVSSKPNARPGEVWRVGRGAWEQFSMQQRRPPRVTDSQDANANAIARRLGLRRDWDCARALGRVVRRLRFAISGTPHPLDTSRPSHSRCALVTKCAGSCDRTWEVDVRRRRRRPDDNGGPRRAQGNRSDEDQCSGPVPGGAEIEKSALPPFKARMCVRENTHTPPVRCWWYPHPLG